MRLPNPGFNLPYGVPPVRYDYLELRCPNPKCDLHNRTLPVRCYYELGGTFLQNEDEGFCENCGTELTTQD